MHTSEKIYIYILLACPPVTDIFPCHSQASLSRDSLSPSSITVSPFHFHDLPKSGFCFPNSAEPALVNVSDDGLVVKSNK